ncbi:MAG: MFS transporter [Rickettsiales bacterium]|nr:MFS transporter [Rickettsiales bacterium]
MFFHPKRQIITRNYDISGVASVGLSVQKPANNLAEKLHNNSSLALNFSAIFSSIFLSAIGYGILIVLIAFKLEANIESEILMSICGATQIGAGIIFARFLPEMGRKTGLVEGLYIGSIISAVFSLVAFFYINYVFYLITIFFLGTSFFICGVTRNTIMIDMAPSHMRALIISIGTMLVAIGNSLGPILLNLFKTSDSFFSFILASIFYLMSMLPLKLLKKVNIDMRQEKKIGIWRYVKNSPKIMFAGFASNYALSSSTAFLIIFGIKIGMQKDQASLLLSALLVGTIFSIPIGYLADIFNRRMMMIGSTFLALFFATTLYCNYNENKIYVLLFLMFGSLAGIKLPAIVLINEKYKPSQRLAVNSAFSRFSLIGNICGLFITGALMRFVGPRGLWLSVILVLSAFLFFCICNYYQKIRKKEFKFENFSIFNKYQNEQLSDL